MLSIAIKNIKGLFKNIGFLIFLIVVPLFQIELIKMISDNSAEVINNQPSQGFVEMIIISNTKNAFLVQLFSTGIIVQFLLKAGVLAAAMIVKERQDNTLMRIYASPISKIKILTGIFIGHSISVLLVVSVLIGATFFIFNVSWGDSWFNVFIVTLFAVYVSTALAFVISGVFKSSKVAGGVSSVIIIVMTFMSGGFIQTDKLNLVSKFTINMWISDAYMKLMEGKTLLSVSQNLIILGLIGTLLMLISVMIYKGEGIYE